jgi:hypothetical protein
MDMASIADRIDNFFIQMEWPFERIDNHLWVTRFPGDIQVHEIFISHDEENWITFRSVVCQAPRAGCERALQEHLLRLNGLIPLTKFCQMEDGSVFAMVDLPTADLDYSEFHVALTTLANHVDAYDNEIMVLRADQDAHSSLLPTRASA